MRSLALALALVTLLFSPPARAADAEIDPSSLAQTVTIYRDEWGVPHIDAATDEGVVFGFAYAQCEDYFWQVEDSYLQCLGRYAEVVGDAGLESDLLNNSFEVVAPLAGGLQRDRAQAAENLRGVRRRAELLPGHASGNPTSITKTF